MEISGYLCSFGLLLYSYMIEEFGNQELHFQMDSWTLTDYLKVRGLLNS